MDGPYESIDDIARANARAGRHWFDPGAMDFFSTRIEGPVHGGRYFVTSEQFVASDGSTHQRRYTVRVAGDDGEVSTVGDFQAFDTPEEAHAFAADLATAVAR